MDMNKLMSFLSDPMSAQRAADLDLDPRALMASMDQGLKAPSGPETGLQMPGAFGTPDLGAGVANLQVPELSMGTAGAPGPGQVQVSPGAGGMNWMGLLQGASMLQPKQQGQTMQPPGPAFVGGSRQVKLNPFQTTPSAPSFAALANGKY